MAKFKVVCTRIVEVFQTVTVEIEAPSQLIAEERVEAMSDDFNLDWRDDDGAVPESRDEEFKAEEIGLCECGRAVEDCATHDNPEADHDDR